MLPFECYREIIFTLENNTLVAYKHFTNLENTYIILDWIFINQM